MTPLCVCGHYGDAHFGRDLPPREGFVIPKSAVQTFAPFACAKCACADFKDASAT